MYIGIKILDGTKNMYNWRLFQVTKVGRKHYEGKFILYKLIRNCAYLVYPWTNNLFKICVESWKIIKKLEYNIHICFKHIFGDFGMTENYYQKDWDNIEAYQWYSCYMYIVQYYTTCVQLSRKKLFCNG